MSTNQHLDALLIGALYGELSPAETLTLDAHLLAHPADAGLLAQLRQIHAVVRSGGLTQGFIEPPQAVSALLLQEAARKAPKKSLVSNASETPNWFIRFVRSIAVHPGLAAAASLALVAGIAGVLFTRGQGAVQDTAPARSAVTTTEHAASAGSAAAQQPLDLAESTVARDQAKLAEDRAGTEGRTGEPQQAVDDLRRGKLETMTANIDDSEATGRKTSLPSSVPAVFPDPEGKKLRDGASSPAAPVTLVPSNKPTPKKVAPKDYIAVSTAERQPIENDELPAVDTSNAISGGRKPAADADRKASNSGGATGAAKANTSGIADKASKKDTAEAAKVEAKPTSKGNIKPADTWATSIAQPTSVPAAPVQAPAVPPSVANQATTELAWVRGEHEKLKKLVAAGKCSEAAKIGAAMAVRSPDYYQQYVATDRQVQACAAYIRERRTLESEKTAAGKSPKATTTDSK